MSLFRSLLIVSSLLVVVGFALPDAGGQDTGRRTTRKPVPQPPIARRVYTVLGGSAEDLARLLSRSFQAERNFLVTPNPASNSILLSGPRPVLDEALTVLQQIDRPARTVHVHVLFLQLASANAQGLEGVGLSGSTRDVEGKIRDLQRKGVIVSARAVELTTLEGQTAHSHIGANRPFVTGTSTVGTGGFAGRADGGGFGGRAGGAGFPGGGGRGFGGRRGGIAGGASAGEAFPGGGGPGSGTMARSISYRNIGTTVQVFPMVRADGQVTLELHIEDSGMHVSGKGTSTASGDADGSGGMPEITTSALESRLAVPPGRYVLAQGVKAGSKTGQEQTVILVSVAGD